jgi:predicted metalloprotease with PDZ domain
MKRTLIALAVLTAFLAVPVIAGEGKGKKCSEDTQSCLNYMAAKYKTRGWLGIIMDHDEDSRTWKVQKVVPGSPAEASGFQAGDQLISANGAKYADKTDEKCAVCDALKDVVVGSKVTYVVSRGGNEITLTPTMAQWPSDALAQAVGLHMLEHSEPEAEVAKK